MHILQLNLPSLGRCLGIVRDERVVNVTRRQPNVISAVTAVRAARNEGRRLAEFLNRCAEEAELRDWMMYADLLSAGQVRAPIGEEPGVRVLLTGTGLTHTGSVKSRDDMHKADQPVGPPSDSKKMFELGRAGGRPEAGRRGVAPEWFFKGDGRILRGPGEPLDIPAFAPDGGEEPEIAGVYLIDDTGTPRRLGFVQGNEWSDHVTEKINYLYLAPSKLRTCAIGPELVTDLAFDDVRGRCRVLRGGRPIYDSGDLLSGEKNMCHSLANLEDHHFKFPEHRQPGDVHVHFFGTMKLSYGTRDWQYQDGDEIEVCFDGMGAALRNRVRRIPRDDRPFTVEPA